MLDYGMIVFKLAIANGKRKEAKMEAIAKGLKRLESEVTFWVQATNENPSDFNLSNERNAKRALNEFKTNYKIQLAALEKYPFLANK